MNRTQLPLAPSSSFGLLALLLLGLGGTGCKGSTTAKVPETVPASGSNAAIAVVQVGTRSKAYLFGADEADGGPTNATSGTIVVVDVGVAGSGLSGASAQLGVISLGMPSVGASLAGDSTMVVAAGVDDPAVWFIDPVTDTLKGTLALDPAVYPTFKVSDRTPVMSGVAFDAAHRRAYLSVWNGIAVVDVDTRAIVQNISAAPTESFAFDSVRGWLLAPFYGCAAATVVDPLPANPPPCDTYRTPGNEIITEGLNLVDLASGVVYTYQNAAAAVLTSPLGVDPDGSAVSPLVSRLYVANETDPTLHELDLTTAQLDHLTRSFTATQYTIADPPPAASAVTTLPLTSLTADPSGTIVVAIEEGTDKVGFVKDADLKVAGKSMIVFSMPDIPGVGPWVNRRDPHGLAFAVINGHPSILLVNTSQTVVARLDVATLLAATHADPAFLTAAEVTPAVTYLDPLSPP